MMRFNFWPFKRRQRPREAFIDAWGDRIDGQEDLDAREAMFDELERRFWERGLDNLNPTPGGPHE